MSLFDDLFDEEDFIDYNSKIEDEIEQSILEDIENGEADKERLERLIENTKRKIESMKNMN